MQNLFLNFFKKLTTPHPTVTRVKNRAASLEVGDQVENNFHNIYNDQSFTGTTYGVRGPLTVMSKKVDNKGNCTFKLQNLVHQTYWVKVHSRFKVKVVSK